MWSLPKPSSPSLQFAVAGFDVSGMQVFLCETLLAWPSSAHEEFFRFPNVLHKHGAESGQSCRSQCSEKAGVGACEESRH